MKLFPFGVGPENIDTLTKKVEIILEENEQARNSDMLLSILLWQRYCGIGSIIFIDTLYRLPNQEYIGRIRRMFQGRGMYLPTDENIAKQRRISKEKWTEYMSRRNTPAY